MNTCYFVSDLHGSVSRYDALFKMIIAKKPSFLFIGGDNLPHVRVSDKQKQQTVNPFIDDYLIPKFISLQRQLGCNYPEVYLIMGNDDYKVDIPGLLKGVDKELWNFLNSDKLRFGPYTIYGYSYVPPTPFKMKDWDKYDIDMSITPGSLEPRDGYKSVKTEDEHQTLIADDIELLAGKDVMDKAIFLFHAPPYGSVLDQIEGGVSIGSKAIANFIKQRQPYLTLHGHAHESARLTGNWRQVTGRTSSYTAAHDGTELSIVIFQLESPENAERILVV